MNRCLDLAYIDHQNINFVVIVINEKTLVTEACLALIETNVVFTIST